MSKLLISIISVMALVLVQITVSTAQMNYGATLGLTSSNLSFDPDDSDVWDALTSFTVGGVIEYPINDNLNLRTGASLTSKGAQISLDLFGFKIESTFSLSYLTIPVLAQYTFNTTTTTPYLLGGLDIGILMKAEIETTNSGFGDLDGTETEDVKDNLSSTDIAINIGGGYMMEMGNARVYGEVLYSLGLLDIDTVEDDATIKTKALILSVGYMF